MPLRGSSRATTPMRYSIVVLKSYKAERERRNDRRDPHVRSWTLSLNNDSVSSGFRLLSRESSV